MRILSIDALRDQGGWSWNQWYTVGTITPEELATLKTNRQILKYMRTNGFLSTHHSAGRVAVEDDQYNLVIMAKGSRRPLFAIEYGNED